jgi:hypothetical protein
MAVSKITLLSLEELYARKITPSVEAAIHMKEDFSQISTNYCEAVCKLKCKSPQSVRFINSEVDILIIQDHAAPNQKFDRRPGGQEATQKAIIDFLCVKAGFAGLTYRLVNLLKCAPTEADFPRGKPPSITTISKCKPYLFSEIERAKPKAIISLSTAVTKALGYKKHSNTGNRGEIVNGNTVITLHPRVLSMIRQNASGKMWWNDYFNLIKKDFEKAAAIARGELVVKSLDQGLEEQRKNIFIRRSLTEVQETIETICNLPESAIISCDTETTSLSGLSEDARLLCIQFGWRDPKTKVIISHVIPLWHRMNTAYNPSVAWKMIAPVLLSKGIKKVFQNGKFDILYIYFTTGVRCQGIELDTMLMLHALSSGEQGCYGLKAAIGDWAVDLGITGYEKLLPSLTKPPKEKAEGEEDEDEHDEEVTNG